MALTKIDLNTEDGRQRIWDFTKADRQAYQSKEALLHPDSGIFTSAGYLIFYDDSATPSYPYVMYEDIVYEVHLPEGFSQVTRDDLRGPYGLDTSANLTIQSGLYRPIAVRIVPAKRSKPIWAVDPWAPFWTYSSVDGVPFFQGDVVGVSFDAIAAFLWSQNAADEADQIRMIQTVCECLRDGSVVVGDYKPFHVNDDSSDVDASSQTDWIPSPHNDECFWRGLESAWRIEDNRISHWDDGTCFYTASDRYTPFAALIYKKTPSLNVAWEQLVPDGMQELAGDKEILRFGSLFAVASTAAAVFKRDRVMQCGNRCFIGRGFSYGERGYQYYWSIKSNSGVFMDDEGLYWSNDAELSYINVEGTSVSHAPLEERVLPGWFCLGNANSEFCVQPQQFLPEEV